VIARVDLDQCTALHRARLVLGWVTVCTISHPLWYAKYVAANAGKQRDSHIRDALSRICGFALEADEISGVLWAHVAGKGFFITLVSASFILFVWVIDMLFLSSVQVRIMCSLKTCLIPVSEHSNMSYPTSRVLLVPLK